MGRGCRLTVPGRRLSHARFAAVHSHGRRTAGSLYVAGARSALLPVASPVRTNAYRVMCGSREG